MRLTRVGLKDGWRGRALVDLPGLVRLPTERQWSVWLTQLIGNPASLSGYEQLKHSSRNEVIKAEIEGAPENRSAALAVICKRSTPDGTLARVAAAMGYSRARRNFERGLRLARQGIGTAQPLALIERRVESWLVTAFLPALVDLDQIALTILPNLSPQASHQTKTRVAAAVAELLVALEQSRLHHRDLKATNVLIQGLDVAQRSSPGKPPCRPGEADVAVALGEGSTLHSAGQREDFRSAQKDGDAAQARGGIRAVLVDLDGLRSARFTSRLNRRQQLMRLAASLVEYPSITRADYVRFMRSLAEAEGATGSADWKKAFRTLAAASAKYNRLADVRRAAKWRD